MGLLVSLIRNLAGLWRAPALTAPAVPVAPESPRYNADLAAAAVLEQCKWLELELRLLCASGRLKMALDLIVARCPRPTTAEQAQTLMHRIVLPVIEECAMHGDAAVACQVENAIFIPLIKRFEDPSHFEACLGMIDAPMRTLGVGDALAIEPLGPKGATKLLFFVHNLGDDRSLPEQHCK